MGLQERFGAEDLAVVAVNAGYRTPRVDALIEELGVGSIVYEDPSGRAPEAYRVSGVPTTFLIDDAGRLMFKHVGFEEGDEELLAKEIETLIAWMEET